MARDVQLEPTTSRLTAARSTIELLWNPNGPAIYRRGTTGSNRFSESVRRQSHSQRIESVGSFVSGFTLDVFFGFQHCNFGYAIRQRHNQGAHDQPRVGSPKAEVLAEAERQVRVGLAIQADFLG